MKRYLWLLLAGAVAGAFGLAALRSRPAAVTPSAPVAPAEVTTLSFVIGESGLDPALASVPLGHRVVVAIQNTRARPVALSLQGYEDRVRAAAIAPGEVWNGEFVAERPGEAFAWLVDAVPAGRLEVTGSHLVEGHR